MNPLLEQRFFILSITLILLLIISKIAWKKGFFQKTYHTHFTTVKIQLIDLLGVFGIFLAIELLLIPILAILWTLSQKGHVSFGSHLLEDPQTRGWFNLLAMLTASLSVFLFCYMLNPAKKKEIFWGPGERTVSQVAKNLAIGGMTWLLSYPWIIIIGQLAGIVTFFLGSDQHIEQVAVKHLKASMQFPVMFILTIVSIITIVPIAEEILFRGFLQKWLGQKFGLFRAILFTSILFASFHFSLSQKWDNIELLLALFVLSCFLGFIYEKQRNLWAPIGLHMTFNAISVITILWQK
jgi:uncharacterized protein